MTTNRPAVAPTAACDVDGCDRPTSSRGWCNAHHKRWLKYGSPTASRYLTPAVIEDLEWMAVHGEGLTGATARINEHRDVARTYTRDQLAASLQAFGRRDLAGLLLDQDQAGDVELAGGDDGARVTAARFARAERRRAELRGATYTPADVRRGQLSKNRSAGKAGDAADGHAAGSLAARMGSAEAELVRWARLTEKHPTEGNRARLETARAIVAAYRAGQDTPADVAQAARVLGVAA